MALPQESLAGAVVETVAVRSRAFHAVAFAGLDGEQFDTGDLDDDQFSAWGDALGRVHAAAKRYPRGMTARRTWRDDLTFIGHSSPVDAVDIRAELESIRLTLNGLPVDPARFGLIHFDFELDNLVWRNGAFAMLDFDDSAHYWYAADIAFALIDLFDAGSSLDDRRVRLFLDGYTAHTGIEDAMVAAIPVFSRLIKLLGWARMMRSLDLAPGPDFPDWMNGLIVTFQDRTRAYRGTLIG